MVNLLKWCLYVSYFFGRATGFANYEVNFKTYRVKVTRRATICAACLHTLILISMIYSLISVDFLTLVLDHSSGLRKNVYVVIEYSRIIWAVLALVSRWTQRKTFIRLYKSFRRLFQQHPEMVLYCQRRIVTKCFYIKVTEITIVIFTFYILRNQLTIPLCIRIWAIFSLTVIVNGITSQCFIALASIRGRYILMNKDLKAALAETHSLNPKRRGVFVTKCCSLADRLEQLAKSQSELQVLTEWLMRTYQGQVVCMLIIFYSYLVGHCYIMFSFIKTSGLANGLLNVGGATLAAFTSTYFVDCWVNLFNAFHLMDAHEEMVQLLSQRTLLQPGLDQRLEAVIDSFTLNLVRNPLEFRFFGLFKVDKFASFSCLTLSRFT